MERLAYLHQIETSFAVHPAVALIGPRQCGKTTLSQRYQEKCAGAMPVHIFDLEHPLDLARLDNPLLTLESLRGLIIIDEVQRRPDLFPILRVLIDQKKDRKFLILGSASRDLLQQSSETLAGRIGYIELTPFTLVEVKNMESLWLRGGFPGSYLADTIDHSVEWRNQYITTFLERDIPNLGFKIASRTLRRFWMMLAHYHGQIFNASEIGQSMGMAHTTARHHLDILVGTFMIRELLPWYENIQKRQVKSSKIYFRDSGIYHSLLSISEQASLVHHPKLGASWEGMAMEEVIRFNRIGSGEVYFWGIHNQAELDLFFLKEGRRLGFEFKYSDAPTLTASMKLACEHLRLDCLTVIYPGEKSYQLTNNIFVQGLQEYLKG